MFVNILLHILGSLHHVAFHLLLERGVLVERACHSRNHVGRIVEQRTEFDQHIFRIVDEVFYRCASDSLDTANTGGNTAFAYDFQETDIAGVCHMRTTAKLYRLAELHHAHAVAILFAKKSHCAKGFSFGDRHVAVLFERNGTANHGVGTAFHLTDFFKAEFLEVREVEAEHLGIDLRAFLLNVCAKHLTQSGVEQVSGRVVARDCHTRFFVDSGFESGSHVGWQLLHNVHWQIVLTLGVGHFHHLVASGERTLIAYLTTHFGIERSAREHHLIV